MQPTLSSHHHPGAMPSAEELQRRLLEGQTLLEDTPDHLLQVVGVLESYGDVLDAYSTNLIFQAERQFLNPFRCFAISTAPSPPDGCGATSSTTASTSNTPSTARRRCSGMAPADSTPTSTATGLPG
jgi:hypothetical protein